MELSARYLREKYVIPDPNNESETSLILNNKTFMMNFFKTELVFFR